MRVVAGKECSADSLAKAVLVVRGEECYNCLKTERQSIKDLDPLISPRSIR
jgi:hypothetical protein